MSDVVVVDASLAFKWVLAEPDSNTAVILLNKWTDKGISIIVVDPESWTQRKNNLSKYNMSRKTYVV